MYTLYRLGQMKTVLITKSYYKLMDLITFNLSFRLQSSNLWSSGHSVLGTCTFKDSLGRSAVK